MVKAAVSAQDQVTLPAETAAAVRLPGISHRAFEHPAALAALAALRRSGGLDEAAREFRAAVTEPALRQRYLASAVRVGPRQLGCLHAVASDAAATLDLAGVPGLYVRGPGDLTAVTLGLEQPFIVLGAGLLDLMTEPELRFIVGRELGHALAGHAPYTTMAACPEPPPGTFPPGVLSPGTFPPGAFLPGLPRWRRSAALSADRAGLLAAQDPAAALRALLKLAIGPRAADLDVADVIAQAADLSPAPPAAPAGESRPAAPVPPARPAAPVPSRPGEPAVPARESRSGEPASSASRLGATAVPADEPHPMLVLRVAELDRWVRSGAYARIVAEGIYETRADDGLADVCDLLRGDRGTPRHTPIARTAS